MGLIRRIKDFFTAPRRLREMTERYEILSDNHKAIKCRYESMTHLRDALERCQGRLRDQAAQATELQWLKAEVERLRKLNGETNQKYVKAQDAYERLLQDRARRI